jgi:phosphate transport system substrate-binding protein
MIVKTFKTRCGKQATGWVLALTSTARAQAPQAAGEHCPMPTASDTYPTGYVTGAGAHFSWIIFKSLQPQLEKVSGRKILLFGKDSMLGQGCNAGIKNASLNGPGRETFGFICCPLTPQEIDKEKLIVYPLALEPILILVNSSNPVTNLSTQQVRDIFAGKITNWQEVGGNDQPIAVVTRLHCKSRPGHWKTILADAKRFRELRFNVESADEMVRRVSDFDGAIGHTGSTWEFEAGNKVKYVTVDGLQPSAANLATKRYPFYRPLSAVTNQHPSEDVKKIIHEVQTGKGFVEVARRFNLLPVNTPSAE